MSPVAGKEKRGFPLEGRILLDGHFSRPTRIEDRKMIGEKEKGRE
jgi:hypothetical protein